MVNVADSNDLLECEWLAARLAAARASDRRLLGATSRRFRADDEGIEITRGRALRRLADTVDKRSRFTDGHELIDDSGIFSISHQRNARKDIPGSRSIARPPLPPMNGERSC